MARPQKAKKVTEEKPKEEVKVETKVETPAVSKRKRVKMAGQPAFDLFKTESDNQAEMTKELLASAKLADAFKTADDVAREYMPIPWLAFQYMIGKIGFQANTVVEFLGEEGTGKSSLVMSLLCNFARYNMVCCYCNTEPKMLEPEWIERLASPNPVEAEAIAKRIEVYDGLYTLNEMDRYVRTWIHIKRKELGIPLDIPLVLAVDSVTKLNNEEEAKIFLEEDTSAKKTKSSVDSVKTVADISAKPAVTAKWLHEWIRTISPLLRDNNVFIILTAGTTTNMNSGPAGGFGGAELGKKYNKTKTGGQATNQSAALQITVTYRGLLKDSANNKLGKNITLNVVKNSNGPEREIIIGLRNDKLKDTDTFLDRPFDMDAAFCDILVANKIYGITCKLKRYTCPTLGIVAGVRASELMARIMSDATVLNDVCSKLKISGYYVD